MSVPASGAQPAPFNPDQPAFQPPVPPVPPPAVPMPESAPNPAAPAGQPMPAPQPAPSYPTGQIPGVYPTGQLPRMGQAPGMYPTGAVLGMAMPPVQPSPFAVVLKELWPSFVLTWKSRLDDAFNRVLGLKFFWLVSYVTYALAIAFAASMYFGRAAASGSNAVFGGLASAFGGSYSSSYVVYFPINWAQYFFFFLFLSFAALTLRALFIKAAAAIRKVSLPFTVAANIYGQSVISFIAVYLGIFVIVLLPSNFIVVMVGLLASFALVLCTTIAELGTWIGLNKAGTYKKDLLIPHALMTLAWLVSVSVVALLLLLLFGMSSII